MARLCGRCGLVEITLGLMCDACRAEPRPPVPMSPPAFRARCAQIIAEKRGHEAHRDLDLLTNELLRALGYGAGVDLFESAVAHWHDPAHPYPYAGPCPNCERPVA